MIPEFVIYIIYCYLILILILLPNFMLFKEDKMMKRLLLSSSFINIFIMSLNFIFKIFLSHKIDKESLGLFYTFMDLIALGMIFFSGI